MLFLHLQYLMEVLFLGRLLESISAPCRVSFWDLNGTIITALEQINGDLPACAPYTMGDGKGLTRCTKTLWRRRQVQPLLQKSVFLQKVCLWQEVVYKMAAFLFYTQNTMAVLHAVKLVCHCYMAICNCMSCCQWGSLGGVYCIIPRWQVVDKLCLLYLSPCQKNVTYRVTKES